MSDSLTHSKDTGTYHAVRQDKTSGDHKGCNHGPRRESHKSLLHVRPFRGDR